VPINDRKSTSDQEDIIQAYFVTRESAFIIYTYVMLLKDPLCPLKHRKEYICMAVCVYSTIVTEEIFQEVLNFRDVRTNNGAR